MCVTDRHDMILAVKVALNPKYNRLKSLAHRKWAQQRSRVYIHKSLLRFRKWTAVPGISHELKALDCHNGTCCIMGYTYTCNTEAVCLISGRILPIATTLQCMRTRLRRERERERERERDTDRQRQTDRQTD